MTVLLDQMAIVVFMILLKGERVNNSFDFLDMNGFICHLYNAGTLHGNKRGVASLIHCSISYSRILNSDKLINILSSFYIFSSP